MGRGSTVVELFVASIVANFVWQRGARVWLTTKRHKCYRCLRLLRVLGLGIGERGLASHGRWMGFSGGCRQDGI